jgi:UDP-N-acetylglucosamine--N-acetylmuramyl-(pentapeptide) pyrophosphoryl-undecaprenol N-acetylglucosamine transferase
MSKTKAICLVAGSSGGHIIPALQLGKTWLQKNPTGRIIFFCSNKNIDKNILEKYNFLDRIVYLNMSSISGKKVWSYPTLIVQFTITFFKSLLHLIKYQPEKTICTGGYIAIPVCLAAKCIRSNVELYELNVVPGRSVKALLPFANKVFITFEGSKLFLQNKIKDFTKRCTHTQYPVRFTDKDKTYNKQHIIDTINKNFNTQFDTQRKTMFLLGGSQGSIFLNTTLKKWLKKNKFLLKYIQIIHQTGLNDPTDWVHFYKNLPIPTIVFSYDENIKNYYLLADLIICRAGAGTLFEIEFFKKRSLIIPLKSIQTDHQVDNAAEMHHKHPDLFTVQDQDTITQNFTAFSDKIIKILNL